MSTDQVLVILVGVFGIVFVYWFFLMKKENQVEVQNEVTIEVNGGYSPEVISIPKGKLTKLNFIRRDPTECLEEVVLADFKIRRHLPLNQTVTVAITPTASGEYPYSCGMNMFHGKIIVK